MTFAIMSVLPAPPSLSSSWLVSQFGSLSYIHVMIPRHCASSRAACASSRFVRCPMVRCSCVSSCAWCRIVHTMLLLILRFPMSFLSVRSTVVAPAVSAVTGVTAVAIAISIATSVGAYFLPSPACPVSRSLFPLTPASVINPVRQMSLAKIVLVMACWSADAWRNCLFWLDFTQLRSIVWVRERTLLLRSRWCWDARCRVNSTSRIDCRSPFCSCDRCC